MQQKLNSRRAACNWIVVHQLNRMAQTASIGFFDLIQTILDHIINPETDRSKGIQLKWSSPKTTWITVDQRNPMNVRSVRIQGFL